MDYVLPAFLQRRVLRYVLAQLDFFEHNLDLDKLDVRLGRQSVVELRDVHLKVDRLQAICPASLTLKLRSALISHLLITVPANLYSSGIVLEINGLCVETHLEPTVSSTVVPEREEPDLSLTTLLDADHLAQSFVEAEVPPDDAPVESESALPPFLANFLSGIKDRLCVTFTDARLDLLILSQDFGLRLELPIARLSGLGSEARTLTIEQPVLSLLRPESAPRNSGHERSFGADSGHASSFSTCTDDASVSDCMESSFQTAIGSRSLHSIDMPGGWASLHEASEVPQPLPILDTATPKFTSAQKIMGLSMMKLRFQVPKTEVDVYELVVDLDLEILALGFGMVKHVPWNSAPSKGPRADILPLRVNIDSWKVHIYDQRDEICIVAAELQNLVVVFAAQVDLVIQDISVDMFGQRLLVQHRASQDPALKASIRPATRPVRISFDVGTCSLDLDLVAAEESMHQVRKIRALFHRPRRKVVRFLQDPDIIQPESEIRPTLRLEGLTIQVTKGVYRLDLRSSTVKIAGRPSLLGMVCESIELEGRGRSRIFQATFSGLRIDYLARCPDAEISKLLDIVGLSIDQSSSIILDNLVRQRRNGAVLRARVAQMQILVDDRGEILNQLDEFKQTDLSMTELLPESDRPGLLITMHVDALNVTLESVDIEIIDLDLALVAAPFLFGLLSDKIHVKFAGDDVVTTKDNSGSALRFRSNDMDILLVLCHLQYEHRSALLDLFQVSPGTGQSRQTPLKVRVKDVEGKLMSTKIMLEEGSMVGPDLEIGKLHILLENGSIHVPVGTLSDVNIGIREYIDVLNGNLVLETCADSTQALIATLSNLNPKTEDNKAKFRTNIIPIDHLLDSISEDAFQPEARPSRLDDCAESDLDETRIDLLASTINFVNHHFTQQAQLEGNLRRKVRVRDFGLVWKLFDGFDFRETRNRIRQSVEKVQTKARSSSEIVGENLFNSIHIGADVHDNPASLTSKINREINNDTSREKLHLGRSRYHKMAIELVGCSVDFVASSVPEAEIQSRLEVSIRHFDILDHVPSSTWKKFATYLRDSGEQPLDSQAVMVHLTTVRPVVDLAATELKVKLAMLPLRLHVDQDALDFLTRFFEFKDSTQPSSGEPTFVQRLEVLPIRVKLDFKPKRVDYSGLRSGRTAEFMNFFVLERAEMVLRHVILHGVPSLERAGRMLNDIWTPDIKRNQLPNVLAGLGPMRSVVTTGASLRDLVVLPLEEYQRDGTLARGLQRGAVAFAKTSTREMLKLGTKLVVGSQGVLQTVEDLFTPTSISSDWEIIDHPTSRYSAPPLGIAQGLRGAYSGLEHDLRFAKDAIVALPGEVLDSKNVGAAAETILRTGPTIVLRPALGLTKAVGQTLMGLNSALDPQAQRETEDKYKRPSDRRLHRDLPRD